MKQLPADFVYLPYMYRDDYYPNHLVDRVRDEIAAVVAFLEEADHTPEEIQAKFDAMTCAINDLEDAFEGADSELESVARDDIGWTVQRIIDHFALPMDCETAIRKRDW